MALTRRSYWALAVGSLIFRLILICFSDDLNLGSRPEVATPVTSLRRLAEGYWLKNSSMSPYSGSMYHGSPLLLPVLGPLTIKRVEGLPSHLFCSSIFIIIDFITAMLIRATGQKLISTNHQSLQRLNLSCVQETTGCTNVGDLASLIFLWNPFTLITCVGSSTSPIDNLMVVLAIYGACSGLPSLAAFGWVVATHLSLYPAILVIPVILLLGYGPDVPPSKLFLLGKSDESGSDYPSDKTSSKQRSKDGSPIYLFSWRPALCFILWSLIWSSYIFFLSFISLKEFGGLSEMMKKTHGFILNVEDLSPNIGVFWYFFAEVFEFFRSFFLIVFHINILFMLVPLVIRLRHRPCFLAFVYIAIMSMLKSYPSVGDSALYLGLLGLFANELAEMRFSFFLLCGYFGISLLSPVMHNLWIWRGTGNANFYFATGIAYASLQTVLIVESVSTILKHDRMLRNKLTA
ncbi:hypothetical protein J5N97_017741 [Dioscorea zingiberensis]|uniref:GPI transamidase subunit PIG-U n=1 Tax=Dioscorea zingiberensis TaxID=325984 RepID=A0A9D5CLW3_9LILI|nr:hypothetical protein J5N97_017741 [Dioscorea zingiberensis]